MTLHRIRSIVYSLITCGILLGCPADLLAVSVADFGAVGDGQTDNSAAFQTAFDSGEKDIYVPAGVYLLGPKALTVPEQVYLHGAGRASVIRVAESTKRLLQLKEAVRIERLHIDGKGTETGSVTEGLIHLPSDAHHVVIDSVSFANCDRACILTDHANDLVVRHCDFRDVGVAVSIQFSRNVKVVNNTVVNARLHGIQFWGNSRNDTMVCENLIFTGNHVKDVGWGREEFSGGGIWGTGAKRVVMANNIVDGATDVGLDLEWCVDSVITGNTVRNCFNAGISLFYSCERVSIVGNTILNDRSYTEEEAAKGWWVRAGIWLTETNREKFPNDYGHRDISIVGNTIFSKDDLPRRSIWVGPESKNITVKDNTLTGGTSKGI